ncbi:SusC/RagA family TonB-linked outer membrane protein [Hymenobacter ruricola]|uniref:TonB-dependent receptor n=1 Tax=Hymenobacter ruricola TaxID=2791023 RepID=A0ABS0I4D2_9BACT|nr:TonB-dependent receptor [Hymenobacter ruricola]MBF9221802.1 TonB-dependent receptor [Hymenobacter ruricola]
MKKHFLLVWLLFFGSIGLAMAQNRQIQGVVKSAEGEALPGVTVLVEGTTNGASTGVNGDYSLTLPAASAATAKLRFSFVGFVSKEVTVGDQSTINVTLASDSKQLEDVVVIGYQEVQRRDVTGSVASVSAQQLKDIPVNSAAEALSGRLAGVQVTSSEGQPGSQVQIRVRGGGSITQDNSPLYVVDGVQVENALSVISPQDIASVDVLKDASATAIYGARGANGVVIITTKGGREGRTNVNYTGFAGFRHIAKTLPVLQSADYVDYAYEKSRISGGTALSSFKSRFGTTNFRSDTLNNLRNSEFLDWQEKVFGRNAFQQTHNLSISGGNKGTTYALSLTRNDENGIQMASGFTRNLVNFRFDHKASDKFRVGFSTRLTDQVITGTGTSPSSNGSNSTTSTRLRNALIYQPILTPNQSNSGVPVEDFSDDEFFQNSNSLSNPVLTINNEFRKNRSRVFNFGVNATYSFTKNLSFRTTVGFDNTNLRLEDFYGQFSPAIRTVSNLPYLNLNTGQALTLNNSNVLSYSLKFGKHSFDGVLGEETYQRRSTYVNITSQFLPKTISFERAVDNIAQRDPNAPNTPQPAPQSGVNEDSRLLSGFARLNYNYDGKYLFTATLRADGSSKFKGSNKVGYFPAASAAWRFSQENFMQGVSSTLNDAKLRLSYGLSGNNRINDFLYDPLFGIGLTQSSNPTNTYYALNDVPFPGVAAVSLANPKLKWETTASSNVGLDLAFFNNRLQFTADVYYNRTSDLLLNLAINPTSGYLTQLINVGATSNRGLELQLSGTVIQTPDFNWTANTNFSFNRNRVEDLGGGNALPLQYSGWAGTGTGLSSGDYLVQVGQPVGLMYGYVTDGFYTADDFSGYNTSTGQWVLKGDRVSDRGITGFSNVGQEVTPGTIKLKDVNKDGQITADDRQVIGNANPKFTGGLNQQFSYKGFDASLFLNWVVGNDIYNANKIDLTSYPANSNLANGLAIMKDRYRQIDENGAIITDLATSARVNQNATIWSPTRTTFLHSWAIEDGSFLRINNLTVGYTLPKSISSLAKLQSARFYVTLNNLYTFTKYTGYDPEVNTRRATSLTPGVDYAAYPRSRAYLFGMNLNF